MRCSTWVFQCWNYDLKSSRFEPKYQKIFQQHGYAFMQVERVVFQGNMQKLYRHPFRQHQHKTAARLAGNGPCCGYVMRVEPACSQKKLKARHGASVRECRHPHIWRFGTRWSHDSSKILNPWYFIAWKILNPWFWIELHKLQSNAKFIVRCWISPPKG